MHLFVIITRQVYFVAARIVWYSSGVTRPYCLYYLLSPVTCDHITLTTQVRPISCELKPCCCLCSSLGGILSYSVDETGSLCCESKFWRARVEFLIEGPSVPIVWRQLGRFRVTLRRFIFLQPLGSGKIIHRVIVLFCVIVYFEYGVVITARRSADDWHRVIFLDLVYVGNFG